MTTYTWIGTRAGDWGAAGDWSPAGGPPGGADSAGILAGGTVGVSFAQSIDILDVAAGAMLLVAESAPFSVSGTIGNAGSVLDAGTLVVAGTAVTLDGGGVLALNGTSDSSAIFAAAAGDVLVNVDNTIAGGGALGGGTLGLTNEAGGVIDAVASFAAPATLTLDVAGTVANAGLIETTTGTMVVTGAVDNSGTIAADAGTLELQGTSENAGSIEATGEFTGGVLGVLGLVHNASFMTATVNGTISVQGTLDNAGAITVTGPTGDTVEGTFPGGFLEVQGTLNNTGVITLPLGGGNSGGSLEVQGLLDNSTGTIEATRGTYEISGTFDNSGTVNSDVSRFDIAGTLDNKGTMSGAAGGLILQGTVTNSGLMEGGLDLAGGTFDNAGGTIAGSVVVEGGVTVSGGQLAGSFSANGATLDGSTLPIVGSGAGGVGNATVSTEGPLSLCGTLDAVDFTIAGRTTITIASPMVTLDGGAGIRLVSTASNFHDFPIFAIAGMTAGASTDVLTNVNGTIDGGGTITGQIVNGAQGVIAADEGTVALYGGASNLYVDGTITNAGLLESTTQYLVLNGMIKQSAGGTIAGGSIGVHSGVTINGVVSGGTLAGLVSVYGTLDGSTSLITNTGTIRTFPPEFIVLGTVMNRGELDGFVAASPTVALIGAGLVQPGTISAASSGDTLVNVNNSIRGAGDIGGGGMLVLVNQSAGLIEAAGGVLSLDPLGLSNTGTLAANGGTLAITTGTFSNLSATWIADNGVIALPDSTGFAGIAGSVTLDGTAAEFVSSTGTGVPSLTNSYLAPETIQAGGTLAVLNGATFGIDRTPGSALLPFGNAGLLRLGGGTANLTASVSNTGRLLGFGSITAAGATMNNGGGTIEAQGGLLRFTGALSSGALVVDIGATLELSSGWYGGGGALPASFSAPDGLLQINVVDSLGTFTQVGSLAVAGFTLGDTIEIAGTVAGGIFPGVTVNNDGTTLEIIGGGHTIGTLGFAGGTSHLVLGQDANNDEIITAACFAAGTRIDTPRGAVAVEALRIGDGVNTAGGSVLPVRWLGYRRIDCRRHPRPWDVWPIRVQAGAFAPEVPRRSLLLSPDHAVYVDKALIPVRYLVNGASIAQVETADVAYWHVELDRHAVILAEGLPAESYLDTGNRCAFANGGTAVAMHADFARGVWKERGFAPLVMSGPRIARARRKLLKRAALLGHASTDDAGLRVNVDGRVVAAEVRGDTWRVRLPPTTGVVRLLSRRWVPAAMRPGEDDRRVLGVALGRIRLDGRLIALDDPRMTSGWHDLEAGAGEGAAPGWRWTDGDAGLALAGVRELGFDVVMGGRYWVAGEAA